VGGCVSIKVDLIATDGASSYTSYKFALFYFRANLRVVVSGLFTSGEVSPLDQLDSV
jgi:hypothetical protein